MAEEIDRAPEWSFNPYFIGLPILINLFLYAWIGVIGGFNPYFIGLPILIM